MGLRVEVDRLPRSLILVVDVPKICQIARLVARPGQGDELLAALRPMVEQAAREPRTERYVVHRSLDDPDVIWVYETYADEQALVDHGSTEVIRAVRETFVGLVADREVVRVDAVMGKGIA